MKHYWATTRQLSLVDHDCKETKCPELSEQDIIEMQTIDADCNDCKHFKRGQYHKGIGLDWFDGHCMKFNRPTKAYPGQYTGWECFEHRRK